jgi:ABC-type nitrate/sulfonate/bicarbonate transport system substrate-binding protein
VVQVLLKALQYVRQNKKGSVKILADWLKLDPAQADKAYDMLFTAFSPDGRASDEGFNRLVELERKAGRLKNDVPLSRVTDWSFLKETP